MVDKSVILEWLGYSGPEIGEFPAGERGRESEMSLLTDPPWLLRWLNVVIDRKKKDLPDQDLQDTAFDMG